MIRIGVCDDSRAFLEEIKILLSDKRRLCSSVSFEMYTSGEALIRAHGAKPFDIIILDMIMPQMNGMETAVCLRRRDSNVKLVFLTSTSEFAVESYSVKASNYLLKPLDTDKFYSSLNSLIEEEETAALCVTVKSHTVSHRIPLPQIEYVEAEGKLTVFNTRSSKRVESHDPLYTFEEILCEENGFFKCHRSYIVNVSCIDSYTGKDLTMRSGTVIPIARSCQKSFESIYFRIMFGNKTGVAEQ